jgi:hypothetical protein
MQLLENLWASIHTVQVWQRFIADHPYLDFPMVPRNCLPELLAIASLQLAVPREIEKTVRLSLTDPDISRIE